nr:transporter substrate-binding domain-containing protein [Spirochaetaceae bacterium]
MNHFSLNLCLVFYLLTTFLYSDHGENPTISAGSEINYPPYCMVDDQGNAAGFSVDLLRETLKVMNYSVDFQVDQWTVVKKALEEGSIQVLPLVGRTAEREDIYDFTFPYLTRNATVVLRENTLEVNSYEDLAGYKVGVLRGDNAEEFVRRNPVSLEIVTTDTYSEALLMLSQGSIDAVVIQRLLAYEIIDDLDIGNLKVLGLVDGLYTQSFCFAVKEGDQGLLEILNEGLATVMSNGTFDYLQNLWFFPDGRNRRPGNLILIGGDKNYPPYEYLDSNGKPAGFNVELTQAIAEQMNINIEIRLDTWSTTVDKLESGQIDMIQGMFFSPERAKTYSISIPYSIIHHGVITRKNEMDIHSMDDLQNLEIIVMRNDIMDEFVHENQITEKVIHVDSLLEGLQRLSFGEGDCLLGAEIPSRYFLDKFAFDNLQVDGLSLFAPDYGYAALWDNYHLIQEFSQGLSTLIESGEYNEIYKKWLGTYEQQYINKEKVKRFLTIFILLLLLIFIIVISVILTLNKMVKQRTFDLEKEIEYNRRLFEYMYEGAAVFKTMDQGKSFILS